MSDDRFRDAFRPREPESRKPKVPAEESNPNIPMYMAQTPWYLASGGGDASLEHQRKPSTSKVSAGLDDWYTRGRRAGPAAKSFRPGACENCGAMSHKTRDCMERPRKRGARWTGRDIQADEVVQDLRHLDYGYDAKRDRWNGYDPTTHMAVVERYEAVEEERRRVREEEARQKAAAPDAQAETQGKRRKKPADDDFDSSSSDTDDDDDKYAESASMVGQKMDAERRMTVRNLRLREDRAKYLYNLSTDSAHYDPKTRSMREAPLPQGPLEQLDYAGDAFERSQGDVADMQKLQVFAWQTEQRGDTLQAMQANPTVQEQQYKAFQQQKAAEASEAQSSLLERYGGAEHLAALPAELRAGQTEAYVEYSSTGDIVRGPKRAVARSRYEEDGMCAY